jgi:DNA recombination protein RmuC
VVEKLGSQLSTAANSVESLGRRTKAMTNKLKAVESLPEGTPTAALLGFDGEDVGLLADEPHRVGLNGAPAPILLS